MRAALGLFGQLLKCRSSAAFLHLHPSQVAVAAAVARPAAFVSICRDWQRLLDHRPYSSRGGGGGRGGRGKKGDPEDEKMLSDGGGSKDNYSDAKKRVKKTKPRSTIEKVMPDKKKKQQAKGAAKGAASQVKKTAKKAAKTVKDTAKKGVETVKKKASDTAKKVKDAGKKVKDTGKKIKKEVKKGGGGGKKKKK